MALLPVPRAGSRVEVGVRAALVTRVRRGSRPVSAPLVREVPPGWVIGFAAPVAAVAAGCGSRPAAERRTSARARAVARTECVARLDAALAAPVDASTAVALASIDPGLLEIEDLLRRVRLADRVAGWAGAQAVAALADYAGPETAGTPVGAGFAGMLAEADRVARERGLRLETRIARGISDDAAGRDIDAARRLGAELAPVLAAWASGVLSSRHVHAFLEATRSCTPELTTTVLARLAPRLARIPSHRVGTEITKVLLRVDPDGAAARARHARRHQVGVAYRSLPDGLGQIVATHRVEDARAMMERLDTDADTLLTHRRGCAPCAATVPDEIGPARAAAHLALVLTDTDHDHDTRPADTDAARASGAPRRTAPGRGPRSRRGELQVVIDLATLLGLARDPALLAGAPVPAEIARELADTCGSLRRIITDPVTGHLLDYGTRVYLPDPLREFIAARDATCTSPGCGQPATRSQLDHITPYPHGPSDTTNTHTLCKRDHDTKTAGDITITEHHADGSCHWRTRHGQTGTTDPRPYLPPPLPKSHDPAPDDPPPF